MEAITAFRKNDQMLKDFPKWVMYHYFLMSGFIQATVCYCDTPIYTFGAGELLKNPANHNAEIFPIDLSYREQEKTLTIKGYVPTKIHAISKKITEMDILPFCKNVYFFMPSLNDERKMDVFSPLENHLKQIIQKGLEEYPTVCFSHFRFRSLHVFFEFLGQQNSAEITEKILALLNTNFKKIDYIFQLSPLSYLVVSPGISGRSIKNRFQGIYFQVRSIIIDYKLMTTDFHSNPASFAETWEELEI